ncbi:MAG: SPOR domain-containing protein [Deltaproteobacteria bacterium]|jgi:hypothetical protein|nr:SPOR domain-containing protein [Deltaproteobacteria bacterium]
MGRPKRHPKRPGSFPPREILWLGAVLAVALPGLFFAGCGLFGSGEPKANERVRSEAPGQTSSLVVGRDKVSGGVAATSKSRRGAYYTVWAGSYADRAPAARAVAALQKYGLGAFSVKKNLVEKSLLFDKPVGEYHLVLAGLFGTPDDAKVLGSRLAAQGLISPNWRVIPSNNPAELGEARAQTAPLVRESERVRKSVRDRLGGSRNQTAPRAAAPSGGTASGRGTPSISSGTSSAPAPTGFQKSVAGRFVGSYRDANAARDEAKRLTAAGWPASVEEASEGGSLWHRVYLTPPRKTEDPRTAASADPRDMRANPQTLARARTAASRQKGMVLLVDGSGLKGVWGSVKPNRAGTDASSCAGYSQAGRLLASMERFISYVPDAGQLMALKISSYTEPSGFFDRTSLSVRSWWSGDDSAHNRTDTVYGPVVYDRNDLLRALRGVKPDVRAAPLTPSLESFRELHNIPGKKTIILFSDFRFSDKPEDAETSLNALKTTYGSDLDFLVVYGDADGAGYALANEISRLGGDGEAWDGCRLVSDNLYFERFVKRVFRP